MKKFLWFLLIFLSIPIVIKADGITNYDINATVLENGDLLVQEVFKLDGQYNGFERIIKFKNSNLPTFDGSEESFNGSDIYNGSSVELKQIRAVFPGENDFNVLKNSGDQFTKVNSANKGDYGVYEENMGSTSNRYLIYNPSSSGKAFYIEYVITNLAIVHNDVSEIGWNIFTSLDEDVENLRVTVNLPNNQNELRVWAHGPLIGNIDIVNKNQFVLTLNGLYANEAVDTRFVFDKNSIVNPRKTTGVDALDTIIKLETQKAEQANLEREQLKKQEMIKFWIVLVVAIAYLVILIILTIRFYLKHDREFKSEFDQKYFRDIPSDYPPSTVGYLFNKKISSNDLSASVLDLVEQKIIKVEGSDKKDYKFIYTNKEANLNESQSKLIDLIFEQNDEILLEDLKKNAKKDYDSFLSKYNSWNNLVTSLAVKEKFYEKKSAVGYVLYCIFGLFLGFISLNWSNIWTIFILSMIIIIGSICVLIYIVASNKRTSKGNEEYAKWKALKNFLKDFSIIDRRELPEVSLWGKYLVYAVSLGCADKLAKDMALRVQEFDNVYNQTLYDPSDIIMLTTFNHVVRDSVNSAINSARSAQNIANSSSSSGGGFGGGFSGGGGSFGGGGGGGRF